MQLAALQLGMGIVDKLFATHYEALIFSFRTFKNIVYFLT